LAIPLSTPWNWNPNEEAASISVISSGDYPVYLNRE